MTIGRKSWLGFAVVLVAALTLVASADAQGRRDGRGRDHRGRSDKDPACVHDCRDGAKACTADLRDEVRACTRDMCGDEAHAACEACEAGRDSDECRAARDAGRGCHRDCREPLRDAFGTCKDETRACVAACPDVQPRDRTCLRGCKADLRECRAPARDALAECRDGCSALHDAAVAACEGNRCTEECAAARAEARSCVRACRADAADLTAGCRDTFEACAQACPTAG